MFRGNNSNNAVPSFLDNPFQYPADMSNQPKLCGNVPVEFHADTVNYLGKNHGPPFVLQNRCGGDAEAIPSQHKIQFSLNNRTFHDEPDRKAGILNLNPVSTGLRLSYDDDERNSSITSASGSFTAASSVFSALGNDIKREIDQQNKELDHFIRIQEENMAKGVRDIRQRHMSSFLSALEKGVAKKMHEKDLELDNVTRKNKELVETMKQVTSEAQNWCYMAKYNESVVNVLKTNLQQAMQCSNTARNEGVGESDAADDAASCIGGSGPLIAAKKDNIMICRSCRSKEVSVLLMPCRHLCLCKECERFVGVCPVCQVATTASFEVYLS
ncbi:probable boi-related E3 ubiquitin-protein ligase 3 [Phtheirospermum japonicum]|uniref:Probable boi-related E3 ubiquitin-protein ligase 3 n=1 Tax=Phtheirospermum japonicum TaxID=374723 RepID=A0A830BMF5_9LAMI|nr:probable boi-related E3 ubiquitin-protein ligase 3 [Phtheirospermum japonicum]